ncbi:YicC/YloC family endoribonuclease [Methylobacterium sp. SyP6R]|uniref:YicC/YloC family endoribonuclease n=1 Tax=Methylobacterium sp. SyP6R TaxID=2718876 RepID=UPI001F17AD95|nr:YicC/YloC family endoribonuclease [Methylobacterium sp. SyP6R]MCF4129243.1 YicC family protein [Methylobacterium sp. SyP6R]
MSIASMTGFARETGTTGPAHWAWELKSVNGRGLEVRVRVPTGLDAVGEEARALVQKRLGRGTCHLTLTLSRTESAPRVRINETLLASLAEAVTRVPMPLGITLPSVDGLLSLRGVVEVEEDAGDDEALRRDLAAAALRLVAALVEVRRAEGRALAEIVGGQLAAMADLVEAAEACPARQPEAVKARLAAQVASLMEVASFDPARLHQEAVLLAARADVREEIDRLRAHLSAARDLLATGGAVGRRLDFLAQELGREANTLCAKANDVSLSRIGLDLKAVVEQFREQVQNVE